jgi:hypothetical protein
MIILERKHQLRLEKTMRRGLKHHRGALRRLSRWVLIVAVIALLGWAAVWGYSHFVASRTNQVTIKTKTISEKVSLSTEDAAAGKSISISFKAPESWRHQPLETNVEPLLNSKDYLVGSYQLVSSEREALGRITFENVSGWLTELDPPGQVQFYQNAGDARIKKDMFDSLVKLRENRKADAQVVAKVPKVVGEVGDRDQANYFNSADGKMGGIVYQTRIKIEISERSAVVFMGAGNFDGKPVLFRGYFFLSYESIRYPDIENLLHSLTISTSGS